MKFGARRVRAGNEGTLWKKRAAPVLVTTDAPLTKSHIGGATWLAGRVARPFAFHKLASAPIYNSTAERPH